jgi:AcrR family transcriptional regulator
MENFSVKDATGGGRGFPVLGVEACGAACSGERRDAAESRRRVLDAAKALFAGRGVEAVNMYEIGREAGVGQGTLYRRYEHKGALCMALLHESSECFAEEIRDRLEEAEESALEQLEYLLSRLAQFNEENAPLLSAIRDAAGGARRFAPYQNPFYQWLRATVAVLLGRGVERGEIPALDVEYASDAILAPLNIDLYLFQRQELGIKPERIVSSLRDLLLNGLREKP